MTVTGSVPRAGNRSANVSAVARTSEDRGSVRASPFSKRALRKGSAEQDAAAARYGAADLEAARPCTQRASR